MNFRAFVTFGISYLARLLETWVWILTWLGENIDIVIIQKDL